MGDRPPRDPIRGREIPTSPPPLPDEPQARQLAQAALFELEQQANQFELERQANEHWRDEVARKIMGFCMWVAMIVVFVIIISAMATVGWHLLLPEKYHWLDQDALSRVRSAVLSGVVIALGTTYLRRYIGGDRP